MTKLSEFKDSPLYENKLKYVSEVWSSWRGAREQTLNRITNYLFVLNSGALLAVLTYVATKSVNNQIQTSIWIFAAGIFCSAAHAALDYYMSEYSFKAYRKDVDDLYASNLDWEDFVKRNEGRPPLDWLLHMFGWFGGVAFFGGLVLGLRQIGIN